MNGGIFTDWLMVTATGACMLGAGFYAHRKHDYLVAAWTVPLVWIAAFYLTLALQIDPVHDNADLRVILYRPGMFFLLVFMALHFFTGRVNTVIEKVHRRMAAWINRFKT